MYTSNNECRLYRRECTIVPSIGSYASNRFLFDCYHGCRNTQEPAVRHAQCNNGNPTVQVSTERIGCVQPVGGKQLWLWPNAIAPVDATPGNVDSIPQLRVDGTEVLRVCNGPCNRQALVTCNARECNPADDAITERECAQSASELYYVLEVSNAVPECLASNQNLCIRGTAMHATLNQNVRWQAFLVCTGTANILTALENAFEDQDLAINQPYESACASCSATTDKRECSPRQSVRSKAICDVVRKAQHLPPPLRTITGARPVGCFLESSVRGQTMVWHGEDEYPVDLQDTPTGLSERVCKTVWNTKSDEPPFMLTVQTSGICETFAARTKCPGSSDVAFVAIRVRRLSRTYSRKLAVF